MTLSLAGDFLALVDGLQTVTLKDRAGEATGTPSALRRSISNRELASSGGKYLAGDVRWHFETSQATASPELGGTVVEAGGAVWTILAFELATLSTRWACVCRKLSLPVCAQVSIERATYAKGTTGAQEPTWEVVFENVDGYVHAESGTRERGNQRRHNRRAGTCWLANRVELSANDRVVDSQGVRWRIVEWSEPKLGELMAVTVEEVPWPFA